MQTKLLNSKMGEIMNKYRLKVYPKGSGREIYRVIEIGGNASLDNLCGAILEAYDFQMCIVIEC